MRRPLRRCLPDLQLQVRADRWDRDRSVPRRAHGLAAGPRRWPSLRQGRAPERRYDGPHVQPGQIGFAESEPVYKPESAQPISEPVLQPSEPIHKSKPAKYFDSSESAESVLPFEPVAAVRFGAAAESDAFHE